MVHSHLKPGVLLMRNREGLDKYAQNLSTVWTTKSPTRIRIPTQEEKVTKTAEDGCSPPEKGKIGVDR